MPTTPPHDCQQWQDEVLAEARQHAGRDLAHDEETALLCTLLTEGVDCVRSPGQWPASTKGARDA